MSRTIHSLIIMAITATALLLAGCEGDRTQSMLHPRGPEAARIATLWWVMCAVYGGVFLVTLLALAAALLAGRRDRAPLGSRFVLVTGIVLPTLILAVMLVYAIRVTAHDTPDDGAVTVEITGHRWWWQVRYPELGIVDANEVHIPAGVPVRLELRSADVVHSFWVPNLAGKLDMLPEHPNRTWLIADAPGRYRGQCAEYCGTQHALMALWVVAHEPADFERWVEAKQRRPGPPTDPQLLRGQTVFHDAGCATCHRIRDVAEGASGPDLTHIGSRLTLGAGLIPNTDGALAGWVANPQPLKPGALMPPTYMPPADLHALVDYLRSLE